MPVRAGDTGRSRPHRRAVARRARPHRSRLDTNLELHGLVGELVSQRWSPPQIARHLRARFPDRPEMWLCHESIYQAIYQPGCALARPPKVPSPQRSPLRTERDHRRAHPHDRPSQFLGGCCGLSVSFLVVEHLLLPQCRVWAGKGSGTLVPGARVPVVSVDEDGDPSAGRTMSGVHPGARVRRRRKRAPAACSTCRSRIFGLVCALGVVGPPAMLV